jgi:uncharacterized protein (DUF302 family)
MTTMPMPDDSGAVTKSTTRSVSETVSRLTDLLKSKGMKVFDVIDQSAEASQVGLDLRETVMVVFGSPKAGTPVMDAVPLAALELPLKVLIWDDKGQTKVSYVAPSVITARYRLSPDLGQNLAGIDALTDLLVAS